MEKDKTGIYLIGALGSISFTVVAGALALQKDLAPPTGMITSSEIFDGIDLAGVEDLVFGGCDIRRPDANRRDIFEKIAPVHPGILIEIKEDLLKFQQAVQIGCAGNCGEAIEKLAGNRLPCEETLRGDIRAIRSNLLEFRRKQGVEKIVVVNLASTEPPLELGPCHDDPAALEDILDRNDREKVRASTLYAYAAILEGFPYINFTPSNAALVPAIVRLAEQRGAPVMGNDGKTGETLVKSALAPMFACRNLEVMSWSGFNILGNLDGQVLNNPGNKESKIRTKDRVLSKVLGYSPHSTVGIDYVPSLDDQKTAWDFIHFRGFLGAKMSLQFVWQGYDSILAAPLVLDMIRLAELAKRRGEAGLMPHLASFFKAPIGVDAHALADQFRMLLDYVDDLKAR
ncbi:MAG: inositol-3-phosphate synthase [Syntrophobacteraceae bacterium]